MAGITGAGTTYNLPNYVGELFAASPEDTPFLSAIGGLTGGESTTSTSFEWQSYDLRDAADDRQRVEGAAAPDGEARVRATHDNVVEIHQEAVELTYTKLGTGKVANTGDEMAFQIDAAIKQVARDVNKSFITGTYQKPTTNATSRKTRGLLAAITSNVVTDAGPLTEDNVLDVMQKAWENGGLQLGETRTIIVGAAMKRALSKIFIKDAGYQPETRNVGGVNLQAIETDFGLANIMLDRNMPADTLAVVSLEECKPRFLEIPGKGHFFVEELAKVGASEKFQLYGEIGLEYGSELRHGKLILTAPVED